MRTASGVLTARGGMTSHAAVVAWHGALVLSGAVELHRLNEGKSVGI